MQGRSIFVSAGEVSGDQHAAAVVAVLRERYPDCHVAGIAGEGMQEAGCEMLRDISELNVMGVGDVLAALPRIRHIEHSVLGWCREQRPALAILVDFSSFHMRLGRKLRAMGIPVLHYIAPKLWAWGGWRVRRLRGSQDALACILPFEPQWFGRRGIPARYVGNPSAFACRHGWSASELKQRLGVHEDQILLAMLPGSRQQEIRMHVPLLADTLRRLSMDDSRIRCVVPVAPGIRKADLEPLWQAGALAIDRRDPDYALRADAAVAVSGTATLELALWDVPSVLVYRSSAVMMFLARHLVQVKCAGLANIILDDEAVMPELIQKHCNPENIRREVAAILHDATVAARQRRGFAELRRRLGNNDPAACVADMAAELTHM